VSDQALAVASPAESPLARLELACRLLAEARNFDEVKVAVDLAEAARVYARQAQLGLDAQNDAAEVRLRAERRAGELLAEMQKHAGGRPPARATCGAVVGVGGGVRENPLPTVTGFAPAQAQPRPPRLEQLHITRRQSSHWQQLAELPEPVFEAHIRTTRSRRKELTTASALKLARQHRGPRSVPPPPLPVHDQLDARDRFDVADAAALPWPDGQVDLLVCSPPYALDVAYVGGDVPDYAAWLGALAAWLAEMFRVANADWGRLCLNVPLDRDLGGWEPVSADAIQIARSVGWRFRTWIVWDKLQAGSGTHRGSIDSAASPNVTAPVESVLVFYRGSWYRSGPAAMPHDAWLELCGPRGLWRFHGTSDPLSHAPFPEELPLRCVTLFSFPGDVVADPFVGRGTTAAVAARLGRVAWATDRDAICVAATRAWVHRERGTHPGTATSGLLRPRHIEEVRN
jgi:site-specific DNA-methyltransferase (adenine-specific)